MTNIFLWAGSFVTQSNEASDALHIVYDWGTDKIVCPELVNEPHPGVAALAGDLRLSMGCPLLLPRSAS